MFHALEQGWTTSDYLLAHIIDGVRVGNWQQTEGARKRPPRNVPDPFPRPSDLEKSQQQKPVAGDTTMVGDSVATVTTVDDYLERRAELEQRWRDRQQHKGGGG